MADIANLFGLSLSPWDTVVGKWKRKNEVDKTEILQLLEADEPIPAIAHPLLAGLIDGTIKARRGRKPGAYQKFMRKEIACTAARMETMLKDPDTIPDEYGKEWRDWLRAARMKRGDGTMSERAKRLTAELYGVTERFVRACIEQYNTQLRAIAKEHRVPLAAVKRAVGYGKP